MSTTTTTQTATATAAPATSGTAATPESIQQSLQKAMKRTGPPAGGGTPGEGSGGGGGGPPGGAPAQVPVPAAQDVRATGHGPTIFEGDRTKAEHFLDEVRGYLSLNHQVAGFNSPIRKVCYTLTYIKGPKVEGWVRDM